MGGEKPYMYCADYSTAEVPNLGPPNLKHLDLTIESRSK